MSTPTGMIKYIIITLYKFIRGYTKDLYQKKKKIKCLYIFVGGLSSQPLIKYCPLWKWHWALILKDLLNPTSGRDAFHSRFISL